MRGVLPALHIHNNPNNPNNPNIYNNHNNPNLKTKNDKIPPTKKNGTRDGCTPDSTKNGKIPPKKKDGDWDGGRDGFTPVRDKQTKMAKSHLTKRTGARTGSRQGREPGRVRTRFETIRKSYLKKRTGAGILGAGPVLFF